LSANTGADGNNERGRSPGVFRLVAEAGARSYCVRHSE
jgi:hypothetical protein